MSSAVERMALRAVARRDAHTLRAMLAAAQAGLAALESFEAALRMRPASAHGDAPVPASAVPSTARQLAARKAAAARWGKRTEPTAQDTADAPRSESPASAHPPRSVPSTANASHGCADASTPHPTGGDQGGEDLKERSQIHARSPKIFEPILSPATPRRSDALAARPPASAASSESAARRAREAMQFDGTLDAFAAGVRSVTGAAMTPLPWRARGELIEVVLTHARGATSPRAWLQQVATEFARAHDPTYGGYTPRALARWLDAGRPSAKSRTKGPAVQRYEGPQLTADELSRLEVL